MALRAFPKDHDKPLTPQVEQELLKRFSNVKIQCLQINELKATIENAYAPNIN